MSEYFRKPIVKTLMLKGQEGQSIKGITKTGTDGLVDTYTITLTDGTTSTFTVTNGKEISSIDKTGTSGLVDTYTITFNDGTNSIFNVTNGKEISSLEKTGTDVLVDTYTITFNDGTNSTFTVTNGKGISNISKTETSGLVDTYTIEFNDGTTSTFTVTNGDSAYKPAVEALGKRIDNLILSSGTESSAEVVDARTGYDGKAYDTLGTAIRTQVNKLKGDLDDLRTSIDVFESEEKVNTTINTNGKYWNSNKSNSWGTHNDYAVTNIVSFTKGTTIDFKAYGENGVAFFVETVSPHSLNQKTTGISLNFEQYGYLEGRYTFESDASISFSYNTTHDFYVNIVEKTNKVVEYYGKVDNLENRVADLENKVDDLENIINYIPMFRNIGIVGDSLSSGEIAYSDESGNHYVDRFDSSWLSIIGRNNGVNVSHYSQGGMTTKAWLENSGNKKTSLLADDSKNAYFVALGTNDISESYPLGNVSDTSSTNSFVGYLKNIIDVVHTKSPNAVVFLVSTYSNSDNGIRYSNMISEIADLYEYCFFVDFVNHTDIYTSTGGVWSNLGHFTSLGYVKVAKIIEKLLNKIVDENKNYFKFFTLNN